MQQPADLKLDLITIVTTCPDAQSAQRIAVAVVSDGLAACVQRIAGLQSTYVWDGKIQEQAEVLLLVKTVKQAVPALAQRIRALHPYEVPEMLIVPVESGNEAYAQWVRDNVRLPATPQPE